MVTPLQVSHNSTYSVKVSDLMWLWRWLRTWIWYLIDIDQASTNETCIVTAKSLSSYIHIHENPFLKVLKNFKTFPQTNRPTEKPRYRWSCLITKRYLWFRQLVSLSEYNLNNFFVQNLYKTNYEGGLLNQYFRKKCK